MNNVIVATGKVVGQIEVNTTTTGKQVSKFTLLLPNAGGKRAEGTGRDGAFVEVNVWGEAQATFLSSYFEDKSWISIVGELEQQKWEDKNGGGQRSKLIINANKVSFAAGVFKNEDAAAEPATSVTVQAPLTKGKTAAKPKEFDPFETE